MEQSPTAREKTSASPASLISWVAASRAASWGNRSLMALQPERVSAPTEKTAAKTATCKRGKEWDTVEPVETEKGVLWAARREPCFR
ncbi:MAG: hypothetical protein JWP54_3342 [Cryobacterium sp.]|nr:hypothetical protein [Cryobacterium sp.]